MWYRGCRGPVQLYGLIIITLFSALFIHVTGGANRWSRTQNRQASQASRWPLPYTGRCLRKLSGTNGARSRRQMVPVADDTLPSTLARYGSASHGADSA